MFETHKNNCQKKECYLSEIFFKTLTKKCFNTCITHGTTLLDVDKKNVMDDFCSFKNSHLPLCRQDETGLNWCTTFRKIRDTYCKIANTNCYVCFFLIHHPWLSR